ncbi:hypothetical protein N0O92_06425 [Alkalihalobacillus sp. MEB130]|uniref:HEAT repeat domain-containing protein n=1 Tax=Alkalihalobacillus sp. MEB130 TaxID=2976704 RepID=UPI0028DDA7F7|nr:HEAT repeat domain-containing protein [Alkalihalobacillus sp. MEB130]MDT8859863.1 hypothetical protein [Alkalihalobacillus sp. MEB130]
MVYVIWLIISLLLLNTVLLLYLLVRKQLQQHRDEEKEQIVKELSPVIENVSRERIEGIPSTFKRTSLFFEVLEETVGMYLQLFGDEKMKAILNNVTQVELTDVYKKRLKSNSWSERMNVLYCVEDFEMTSLQDDVWSYYHSGRSSIEEKHQMIRVLSKLNDQRLLEQIKHESDWPYFLLKECFRRFDFSTVETIIRNELDSLSEEVQVAILDVAIERKDPSLTFFFDQLLFSESREIRIRALKAIYEYEQTTKEEELVTFHQSNFWVERMLFARVAGQLKRKRYSTPLVTLLSDESWWVRQSAAEALMNFEDGLFILEHVYETNEDPFARDTANQWLGEAVRLTK